MKRAVKKLGRVRLSGNSFLIVSLLTKGEFNELQPILAEHTQTFQRFVLLWSPIRQSLSQTKEYGKLWDAYPESIGWVEHLLKTKLGDWRDGNT